KMGLCQVLLERAGAHQMAPLHTMVVLCGSQGVVLTRGVDGEATAEPERLRGAQRIGVEPGTAPHPAGVPASVAQMHGHYLIGLAWDNPHRCAHGPALHTELYHHLVGEPEPLSRSRTEQRGVIPGELRD